MLVQVFQASAERGGMEEVGWGVWAQAESGGEACHYPYPHHQTHCPLPPPQPFYEIRQRGMWKTAGPFLWVFNQK